MNNCGIVPTADGTLTLWDAAHGEHYHSNSGVYGESMHVFIGHGLRYAQQIFPERLNILECGFGTGLNALLTYLHHQHGFIHYTGIEKYPLPDTIWKKLGYEGISGNIGPGVYEKMMQCNWESEQIISDTFRLLKLNADIELYEAPEAHFHLIYFDAFSAAVQPELWTEEIFSKLFVSLKNGGLLVTYSAKGIVKQALRRAGFKLERWPGFGGKRHMLRAIKSW